MELILDASSRSTRAGLAADGRLRWTSHPLPPQEHTRQLLPVVLDGLRATAATFADLNLVVVALGPGPFNGLRVAVSTAKGLVIGTGSSLVGISTLEAEAYRCSPDTGTVRIAVAAGRTAFTTALFTWTDSRWVQVEEARHIEGEELRCLDDFPLSGELDAGDTCSPTREMPPGRPAATVCGSRIESLATLGWLRYCTGHVASTAVLQPLYARPPHITSPRNRRP
jgi:tRNA threonylcarbamoyladenosine biosynthesis protein TsaB